MLIATYPYGFVGSALMLVVWVALRRRRRVSGVVWAITAAVLAFGVVLGLVVTFLLSPVTATIQSPS